MVYLQQIDCSEVAVDDDDDDDDRESVTYYPAFLVWEITSSDSIRRSNRITAFDETEKLKKLDVLPAGVARSVSAAFRVSDTQKQMTLWMLWGGQAARCGRWGPAPGISQPDPCLS